MKLARAKQLEAERLAKDRAIKKQQHHQQQQQLHQQQHQAQQHHNQQYQSKQHHAKDKASERIVAQNENPVMPNYHELPSQLAAIISKIDGKHKLLLNNNQFNLQLKDITD